MSKTDEQAYAAVEAELRKNPDAPQDALWEKAKEASPGISKLSRREFNARYPLQIKRRLQREAGGDASPKRGGGRKRAAGTGRTGGRKAAGRKQAARKSAAVGTEAAGDGATPARRPRGRPRGSGTKRAASPAAGTDAATRSPDREAIRQLLLTFATDVLGAADQPKDLVRLLAGVDRYVDRVIKTAG